MLVGPGSPLRRISMAGDACHSDLWLLTHADLRHAPRIKLFIEHMAQAVRLQHALLTQ
jgi:hypothetical protein